MQARGYLAYQPQAPAAPRQSHLIASLLSRAMCASLLCQRRDRRNGVLIRRHYTHPSCGSAILLEAQPVLRLAGLLVHLAESVALVAQVPGDVALDKHAKRRHHLLVFVREDGDELLGAVYRVGAELLEGAVDVDALGLAVVLDQAGLVALGVVLLVEGEEVVDPDHPVLHLGDGGGDFEEELFFVEVGGRPEGGADAVAEAVHATQEAGVVV